MLPLLAAANALDTIGAVWNSLTSPGATPATPGAAKAGAGGFAALLSARGGDAPGVAAGGDTAPSSSPAATADRLLHRLA